MAKKKAKRKSKGRSKKKQASAATIAMYREKFKNLDKARKTGSAQAIARRRADVWEMMCQGIPKTEIANILHVSRATVMLDAKYLTDKVTRHVARLKEDPAAVERDLGMTIAKLDSVIDAAFQEYAVSKTGSEKDKFLNTAAKCISTRHRILQETGFMPKAGNELTAKVEHQVSFADRFGEDSPLSELDDPTTRHKILDLTYRLLEGAAKGEVIDVEGMVITRDPPALEDRNSSS